MTTKITNDNLVDSAKVVRGDTAPSSPSEGDLWYDTTAESLKFYQGSAEAFVKVSAAIAALTSVSGNLYAGAASTLTLTGENFLTDNLIVNFTQTSDSIDVDVSVTPASDTSATVTVPSSVYSNVTSGNAVSITVTNSDNTTSSAQNKTALAPPSGGTVSTSGSYRIHTFTSSGSFVNTISSLDTQYLVIAGGGGGGGEGATYGGGGGGAGGYRNSVPGESSGGPSSAETPLSLATGTYPVTVGAGGNRGDLNNGSIGGNSVFSTITATGGGGGQSGTASTWPTSDGGSGGGVGGTRDAQSYGTGISGQGNPGGGNTGSGTGGGGGGAGQAGFDDCASNPVTAGTKHHGDGGDGLSSSITGSPVFRGGGGGGGDRGGQGPTTYGLGGTGGGATGASDENGTNATTATANTGGGGGGASSDDLNSSAGASGVVIIRYQLS